MKKFISYIVLLATIFAFPVDTMARGGRGGGRRGGFHGGHRGRGGFVGRHGYTRAGFAHHQGFGRHGYGRGYHGGYYGRGYGRWGYGGWGYGALAAGIIGAAIIANQFTYNGYPIEYWQQPEHRVIYETQVLPAYQQYQADPNSVRVIEQNEENNNYDSAPAA